MSYFVPAQPNPNQVSQAINYALANLGGSVSSNLVSGQIVTNGTNIGYLYQYMDVAFATAFDGSSGFSTTSYTNATYFGLRNTNSTTVSTNPTDYVWYQVAGSGFGTTEKLWYNVTGGRNIQFQVSTTAPAGYYVLWTADPINLDIITSTLSVNANLAIIYQWTSGSAPARPTTTSTYTWATNTFTPVPSGWSSTLPSNSTPGAVLWEIQVPISANVTVPTSLVDWTNTSYAIVATSMNGATGPAGAAGANGANGLNAIYAYLVQNQSLSPPTFTSTTTGATAPSGWSLTPPTGSYIGQVFWYIFGQYNSSSITINGISPNTTAWSGPTAASIFQDIESDNWNGSVPPTYGNPSTYGSTGYYISRNTGDVYFNNGIFRGDITGASGTFSGALSGATGTFAGSLSAATGSFAGSLNAATGSFNGTLSTGSSPPVINSSTHTISSGAGALINSNGTFALGSTTSNIVDDGTGVYLNGFVYGNSSSYAATAIGATASPIIMPVSPGTFTVTKTGNVIISSIGSIQLNANISSLANVPNVVFGTIPFQILNSSSTVIASLPYPYNNSMINYTSVYSGSSPYDALATIPFNFSTLVALTPGTYTLIVNGSQFYSDALYYQNSSSYTTRNVTSLLISASATLFANSYWYQIG
jgi:hypothetical protein